MSGKDFPDAPETVAHYRIDSPLGVGELGMVYRAWDERLERWVALKQAVAGDADSRERFRAAARAIAGLTHPSLVRIYDFVHTDDGDWIVMEFIDGRTLHRLLAGGPLDPVQAMRLAREIAEGLAAAHEREIVFLTLMTESVLVSSDGHARILDFGLARLLDASGKDNPIQDSGAVHSAMRAMAPEQALDQPVDHRSDLFSLGTLLYETVTGSSPFRGATDVQTLQRLCGSRQESARQVNPRVPEELSALIDRLLEKAPADRPQSAREVIETLRDIETSRDPGSGTISIRLAELSDAGGYFGEMAAARESQLISLKTLLVTDLVGSTQLVEDLGDTRAAEVLAQHDRQARDLMTRFQGREIDKTDGFLILFKRPVDAVRFALQYHVELARLSEEEGVQLLARVGVHLGEVILTENPAEDVLRGAKPIEVQGLAKPIAARLMSLANGGQTLLSRAAFDLSRRAMDEDVALGHPLRWLQHGEYRFKGVDDGLQVFEVGVEGVAPLAAPADAEKARRVVRETPAGSRRTWQGIATGLVVALLIALAVRFFFLPSGPAGPAIEARPAIAVLGFKNLSGRPEIAWLSTALAELFTTDLATGGELRLIPGERIARMKRELSLPDADTLGSQTLEAISRNLGTDYVLLGSYLPAGGEDAQFRLLLRLQDTRREEYLLALTDSGTEAEIFDLVSRTGAALRQELGVTELSAAEEESVRAMLSSSPEANRLYSEGLERLRAFDALGARDHFQQAVEIEPGFALAHGALSEAWRALGYDLKAEESARQAYEQAAGLPPSETLLIEGRYREASGDLEKAAAAFRELYEMSPDNVDHGVRLAETQIVAGQARDALATLESLRALPPPASDDPRIDLAEAWAADLLSDYQRQVAAAERAIEKGREQSAWILVAEARQRQWRALRNLGRSAEAKAALEEARRLLGDAGDRARLAEVLNGVAILLEDEGKSSEAEGLYRQALEIHRETGNRKGVAAMLNNLADLDLDRGELQAAKSQVDDAVAAAFETGDRERQAKYLDTRAWLLIHLGAMAEAERSARQAQTISQEIGNREGMAWGLYYRGRIAFATGDPAQAAKLFEQAAGIGREIDNRYLLSFVLGGHGDVLLAAGDAAAAHEKLRRAVELRAEIGNPAELIEIHLSWIRGLLATRRTAEAEVEARQLLRELGNGESADSEALARALLARILVAQGQLEGARRALQPAQARAATSQNPEVRLSVALSEVHLLAATRQYEPALAALAAVDAEAAKLGLTGYALEARLARGEIEVAAGGASAEAGRERLAALAAEARSRGYGLIAERAAARL